MAKPWEQYADTATVSAKPWERFAPVASEPIDPTADMSTTQKVLAGVGKGMTDLVRGVGQMRNDQYDKFASLPFNPKELATPKVLNVTNQEVADARKLDAPLMETKSGKVGNFIGQVAATAPAMLIPGANTYAGAALFGGATGAAQPVIEGESRGLNTALGTAGGLAGQYAGNKLTNAITNKISSNALAKAQNATRDETLKVAGEAGYKVPRSLYNPTFTSNRLESVGGKAAVLQQASAKNQEVTNNLVRQSLDLPDNVPLSIGTVEKVRKEAYKPYQEVASISKAASNALEELKQAKSDASAWFNSYNRSANPEHLAKAKDFQETADIAEQVLEDYAKQANKPELIGQLKQARKTIAKTYTVERAMNKGTGDIDARVLGRLFDKNKPLSDGLDVIGRFNTSFPKASQPTQQSAGAGISALEPMAGAIYGGVGQMATGNPSGLLAAGIPLLRSPARTLALSKMMQKTPQYGGNVLNLANKSSPLLPYLGTSFGGLLGANSN